MQQKVDLTGWEYFWTMGRDLDFYRKGNLVRVVNDQTGELEMEYSTDLGDPNYFFKDSQCTEEDADV